MADFIAGLSVVESIRESGNDMDKLIFPYILGARQDRANPTGDVGFMLATVGRIIDAYNFDSVIVVDPHSPAARKEIPNMVEYPLVEIYSLLTDEYYDGVIAPDKGAHERASLAAQTLNVPLVQGEKVRDVSTGKLSGFAVNVEAGKHYLVVDDICDGGGTFIGLAEEIKKQEATADLYVTHGIFSKGTNALHEFYQNIYTTNSRDFHDRNDVHTLDILTEMRNFNE